MERPDKVYLNEALSYDQYSGELVWKERPEYHFKSIGAYNHFKNRYAGRIAGADVASKSRGGYVRKLVRVDGELYGAHNIIWCLLFGYWPDDWNRVIDHINGDATDNRLDNLREVTLQENCKNLKVYESNKSGVTGVYFKKSSGRWAVQINVDKRQKHIGYYDTFEEAVLVRKSVEKDYGYHENHGTFR